MHFLSALCAVAPFFGAVRALYPQGLITAPNNDTQIAPGESFEFTYNIRSDYCISSYNYTVWLLTSPLSSLMTLSTTGVFLGRFSNPNFPANPYPTNPAPTNLTMPDFSKLELGGFGTGKSAENLDVWLAVLEEWRTCDPQVGNTISATVNHLIYNATSTTSTT